MRVIVLAAVIAIAAFSTSANASCKNVGDPDCTCTAPGHDDCTITCEPGQGCIALYDESGQCNGSDCCKTKCTDGGSGVRGLSGMNASFIGRNVNRTSLDQFLANLKRKKR